MNLRLHALAATLCATALPAQMSGVFVIDPLGGPGSFPTFTAAVNAMFVAGLNGPYDAQVLSNSRVLVLESNLRKLTERNMRGDIKAALERVLAIDPAFLQGSADRALGRWYYKVPGLFGGDDRQSETHLRKALAYNENSVITRLFLAETLLELGKKAEARDQLRAAIDAPPDPEWAPEDKRFKEQAAALLKKIDK